MPFEDSDNGEKFDNEDSNDELFEPTDSQESAGDGEGTESWDKKFKSPDAMYDAYKNLQSEYTRVKQSANAEPDDISDEDLNLDSAGIEEPENPEEVLQQVVNTQIDSRVGEVIDYVNKQRIDFVLNQVNSIFPDFNMEKNQKQVSEELEKFSPEFKKKNPVEAMVRAIAHIKGMTITNNKETEGEILQNFSESP